jgi:hypothetical protein
VRIEALGRHLLREKKDHRQKGHHQDLKTVSHGCVLLI